MQAYLNSLSQVPGSILYRDTINWKALLPGTSGQKLGLDATLRPQWQTLRDYFPALYKFNGTTGRLVGTYTSAGNLITTVIRLLTGPFTGGGIAPILYHNNAAGRIRTAIHQYSSDFATVNLRNTLQFLVQNSAGTTICRLYTFPTVWLTGIPFMAFFAFNGTTGAATLRINTTTCEDTSHPNRVAPTTGTLGTGAGSLCNIAYNGVATYSGNIMGTFGFHEAYGLDPTSFSDSAGRPKNIESSINTAWSSAPKAYHESGQLTNNRGTIGNFVATAGVDLTLPSIWTT